MSDESLSEQAEIVRAADASGRYQITLANVRSGPLPAPAELAELDRVVPGGADRVLTGSEDERRHRHRMDEAHSRRATMGLGAGFIITLAFLFVSGWLINRGHDVAGTVLGTVDLVALVTVFVVGSRNRSA